MINPDREGVRWEVVPTAALWLAAEYADGFYWGAGWWYAGRTGRDMRGPFPSLARARDCWGEYHLVHTGEDLRGRAN